MECVSCGGLLTGKQRKYCSAGCSKSQSRAAWILKVYGLTLEQWDEIWEHQGRVCAICKRAPRPGETFHLDHEHTDKGAGKVRGIVCPYDNTRIIGRLKSPERAQALADYLRNPPAVEAIGTVIAPGRPKKKRQPRKRAR